MSYKTVQLYHEISGTGDPVLLLHGLGSSTRDWESQVEALSRYYQVITVDVRGHGQSPKPPGPYSIPLFTADVIALLRELDTGPVHAVGISMGGMIGLQLALDAPELTRSLVVINSGPKLVPETFGDRLAIRMRFVILRLMGMEGMGKFLAGRLFPEPGQEALREVFIQRWAENDVRAYRDAMRGFVGWTVADQLTDIQCPVLILASDQDYTTVEEKERLFAPLSQAQIKVINNAHHAVTVEHPQEVNQLLFEFLATVKT